MAENVKEMIQVILNELEEEVGFNTVSKVMKELGDAYFHKRIWRKKTSKLVEKYPEASPLCDMIDITLFDDNDTAYPRYCKVTATINNEYMLYFRRNNENGDTDASLTFKGGFINFYPKLPTDKILKIMKHLKLTNITIRAFLATLESAANFGKGELTYGYSKEELDKYIPSLGPKSARSVLPRPDENSPPPKKKQKVNEDTL